MVQNDKEIDDISGTETTGHEWDGIKELNTPLPTWWIYTFYATVVWAVLYVIAMPAIPLIGSYTKGVLGYSQRQVVADQVAAAKAERQVYAKRLMDLPLEEVNADPELAEFARAAAKAAFGDNCATCHGSGAQGFKGYPNLNDDDWLWGGDLETIQTTLNHGIRSDDEDTRYSEMPRFVADGLITRTQAQELTEYVLSLAGAEHDVSKALSGAKTYSLECAACHGTNGKGDREQGAPNLTDSIWLHGGERAQILESISDMKGGVMPAWNTRLEPATIRSLAIYVHSLGGGE